jgi:uroporphyrinogen-III decarboxylase
MAADPVSSSTVDMEARYQARFNRYVTAMRNEKPDMVPIRPFVAEFTGRYSGHSCQQLAHDYNMAFDAACKCAADFDWDAVVANMVYVWTGLTQAIGLKYYGVPGIDVPANMGFQYLEPPEDEAFMRADEYDQLIEDPTGFLYNVWLPRVVTPLNRIGDPVTSDHNLSLLKGGMAMMQYFMSFPGQIDRLRRESGTASAIAGIFKAPMDIIADKLRGYLGLVDDLMQQPDKVLAACEALMPYLYTVAKTTADPTKNVPIGYWMHRGCVPFVTPDQFSNIYWPTVKPIIEELWADGHQTLFYAEGSWDHHLEAFAELPDLSIVYHVDQGDIFKAHEVLGHKFCLSGGIPNFLLAFRPPTEVQEYCRKVIDGVARDGGYILDASAIVQNDATVENMRAMTEFVRDYGVYSDGHSTAGAPVTKSTFSADTRTSAMPAPGPHAIPPGSMIPWATKRQELGELSGDVSLLENVWAGTDALAFAYIWQVLLSF